MNIGEVRTKLFGRDHGQCFICGSITALCLDHLLPKPQYQYHVVDNLITLCWKCNSRKGIKRLPRKEEQAIYNYLIGANRCFSVIEVIEMNEVLTEYFTVGEGRSGKRRKKKRKNLYDMSAQIYEANLRQKTLR
jgi:hypothetical protein